MNKQQAKALVEDILSPCIGTYMEEYTDKVQFQGLFNRCLRELNRQGFNVHSDVSPYLVLKQCDIEPDGSIMFNYF